MKNRILLLVTFCMFQVLSFAQPDKMTKDEKEEYIRTQKIAFISTQLNLTTQEAEKFWPIYNEYDAKMTAVRDERRGYQKELKNFTELTDDRAYELTEKLLACDAKEADLRKEYLAKFAEVIGKKKAAQVFYAEEKFKRELLKEIQQHHKNDGPPPPRN